MLSTSVLQQALLLLSRLLDLYQQCTFLSPECLGFHSYYAFQNRYARTIERNLASHSFKQIVGYQRIDELQEKLSKFAFRVRKDECFDLPEKTFVKREVELTDEQRKPQADDLDGSSHV